MINNLPTRTPPIVLYLYHAYPLSIIFTQEDKILPWFYSNFLQISCRYDSKNDEKWFDFDSYQLPPNLSAEVHTRNYLKHAINGSIETLFDLIDQSKYIYTFLNEYYTKGNRNFNKRHVSHDILIHGYNKTEGYLICSGFYNRIYNDNMIIPIDLFVASIMDDECFYPYHNHVTFYSLDRNEEINFDLKKVMNDTMNYINSIGDSSSNSPTQSSIYGINVYNSLINRSSEFLDKGFLDIRPYHLFFEHKNTLNSRLSYMFTNKIISFDKRLYDHSNNLKNAIAVIRNLALKVSLSHQTNEIPLIMKLLTQAKQAEKTFFETFLDKLSKSVEY
ncbi:hypothetical protein ACFSR7_01870 [Cohnella sp. GCM10020058]|uniref:hypothetical protein n=1 Tax=Cohnella sp. GCM10020058 TaxID=3317330 RepID=UPI003640BF85